MKIILNMREIIFFIFNMLITKNITNNNNKQDFQCVLTSYDA